ncbi:uncharacterized protein SAPINGB_P003693 [Magnusiomyces paraingens]|uniref:Uncharacterized protein n=1 Tax=Magnusiomyces paraingens TaxID=2606893 RepID=A0A5E8BY42_9ASCO|nr:uncharacterized protein SAPINGB_P003693 [Saprochaete ingens]VVT53675.1 unnamed protein product [Saprochaete ingens]
MSHFTTIHELTSYLSWYPAYTYVRFFGRVVSYDDRKGVFTLQELPAFFVEATVNTSFSSQSISSQQSPPISLTPRPLPVANLYVQSESGVTAVVIEGSQVSDTLHNNLIVEVFARVRSRQPGLGARKSSQMSQQRGDSNAPTPNVAQDPHVRAHPGVGDSSSNNFAMPQPQSFLSFLSSSTTSSTLDLPPAVYLDLMSFKKLDTQTLFDNPTSEYVQAVLLKAVLVRESLRMRVLAQAEEEEYA